jgi:hypothetical protein
MPDPLQQVCVSLPPSLVALVQQHAAQTDRTIGGMIRHVVSEWARSQPPREGVFNFPTLPGVPATVEGVRAAEERIDAMRKEQDQIRRKKKIHGTSVDEDARHDQLHFMIELTLSRLAAAQRQLRPSNGGQNG